MQGAESWGIIAPPFSPSAEVRPEQPLRVIFPHFIAVLVLTDPIGTPDGVGSIPPHRRRRVRSWGLSGRASDMAGTGKECHKLTISALQEQPIFAHCGAVAGSRSPHQKRRRED